MLTTSPRLACSESTSRRRSPGLSPELWLSIAAGTIMALMVAAGGTALAGTPDEGALVVVAPLVDPRNPLVVCRDDHLGYRCIPEAS